MNTFQVIPGVLGRIDKLQGNIGVSIKTTGVSRLSFVSCDYDLSKLTRALKLSSL